MPRSDTVRRHPCEKTKRNCAGSREFEVAQNRLRVHQIETMIAEFDRMCVDLGHQIATEEVRVGINDPKHFAYPTYAKAVRDRRTKLQQSVDALRVELTSKD